MSDYTTKDHVHDLVRRKVKLEKRIRKLERDVEWLKEQVKQKDKS